MNRRTLLGGLFAAASVPALAACSSGITSLNESSGSTAGGGSSKGGLTIGTANFTENQVLGYLYAAVLQKAGVNAKMIAVTGLAHYEAGRFREPLREAIPWLREVWK